MQPPERIVHAREGGNALGEPDLTKPALGLLELEIVSALPMTATGKVQKHILRADIKNKFGVT